MLAKFLNIAFKKGILIILRERPEANWIIFETVKDGFSIVKYFPDGISPVMESMINFEKFGKYVRLFIASILGTKGINWEIFCNFPIFVSDLELFENIADG